MSQHDVDLMSLRESPIRRFQMAMKQSKQSSHGRTRTKKSRLKPALTQQKGRLTGMQGLDIPRLSPAERKLWRRVMQKRRAARTYRAKQSADAKMKRRLKTPTWRLPPDPPQ